MTKKLVAVSLMFALGTGSTWAAGLTTARKAAEIASKRLPSQNQSQVLRIDGRRSDSNLQPREWNVTFYDDTRVNKALTVRVTDGQDTETGEPLRMFKDGTWEHFDRNFSGYKRAEIIDMRRWKLDSDDALNKALKDPKLDNVQVSEVRMSLRKLSDGDVPPVWRIWLRARARVEPRREAWIGHVDFSAESGEVLENELRPGKVMR